jgi:hypothetical protein
VTCCCRAARVCARRAAASRAHSTARPHILHRLPTLVGPPQSRAPPCRHLRTHLNRCRLLRSPVRLACECARARGSPHGGRRCEPSSNRSRPGVRHPCLRAAGAPRPTAPLWQVRPCARGCTRLSATSLTPMSLRTCAAFIFASPLVLSRSQPEMLAAPVARRFFSTKMAAAVGSKFPSVTLFEGTPAGALRRGGWWRRAGTRARPL